MQPSHPAIKNHVTGSTYPHDVVVGVVKGVVVEVMSIDRGLYAASLAKTELLAASGSVVTLTWSSRGKVVPEGVFFPYHGFGVAFFALAY
jgi:hypothetical protein